MHYISHQKNSLFWYYSGVQLEPSNPLHAVIEHASNYHMGGMTTADIVPLDASGQRALVEIRAQTNFMGQQNPYIEILCALPE